jgi:hypothetical protein
MVQCVVALVLGHVSAWKIALMLPQGHGREASAFAPLFLVLGIGFGLAVGYYALFEALRRARFGPRSRALPFAVARTRRHRIEI